MEGQSQQDYIVEAIRNKILSGELEDHFRLTELGICQEYGVPRAAVKNALRILCERGYLYSLPRSGNYVKPIDYKEILDNFQFRMIVEPECLLIAYPNLTTVDIERIKENCRKMEYGGFLDYVIAELDNHSLFPERSNNQMLKRALAMSADVISRITWRGLEFHKLNSRPVESIEEWKEIAYHLENHQPHMASKCFLQHIMNSSTVFYETGLRVPPDSE
ncbi:GntR family transcriptional regulator [Chakrabartyella piscis]|uniref:GntR family transcriptional regulator n=1 Tax=Chakrabartyella piscis TaxID=2918914 RepID=UPI0029586978|nr:GntR family transcriptional regulator [Chakrabartyella piscis]